MPTDLWRPGALPPDRPDRITARAQHRAEALTRIYHAIGHNGLAELPDVFLVIIERALARDLRGVREFSSPPCPTESSPHDR